MVPAKAKTALKNETFATVLETRSLPFSPPPVPEGTDLFSIPLPKRAGIGTSVVHVHLRAFKESILGIRKSRIRPEEVHFRDTPATI